MFISWTRENGRTADLARELGLEAAYIYLPSRFGLIGRYVRQLRATRKLIAARTPTQMVLMLPPAPALLSFAFSRVARRAQIACDLHTGFFSDPKWAWATKLSLRFMHRMRAVAVVTNPALASLCTAQNVDAIVLHDVLSAASSTQAPEAYLLCPLSYANDEPVDEILSAARSTPGLEWRLTGRAPATVRERAPENVTFTGFVDDAEYTALLTGSLGVVALTTRPHTMQRAGYESFCSGVPHVTSDFPELREFYEDSAEFARPDAASIAAAALNLVKHRDALARRVQHVRAARITEQQHALNELRNALSLPVAPFMESHA